MLLPSSHRGFSLVELSIVLVILGLLTGGILSGQSLIRASEIRAVISEFQRYDAAAQSFRDKYFSIPGDMTNADQFWGYEGGAASNCSAAYTGTTARTGTCDGNGDGSLAPATAVSTTGEIFQFWKQLALAGLIEGSYTGFSGPTSVNPIGFDTLPGINAPKSKMSNAFWGMQTIGNFPAGDPLQFPGSFGNVFLLGAYNAGGPPYNALLKPEEAWNIDTKLDDGKPGTGRIIARYNTGVTGTACTTATATDVATTSAALYSLNNSSIVCSLQFTNAF